MYIGNMGRYNDTAVYAIPAGNYEQKISKEDMNTVNQDLKNKNGILFKAEDEEFTQGSEEVLSHKNMCKRKFRDVMPLEELVQWEQKRLESQLEQKGYSGVQVNINSQIETINDGKRKFKVPKDSFGQIEVKGKTTDIQTLKQQLQLDDDNVLQSKIEAENISITIDGINPLLLESKIKDRVSVRQQEKTQKGKGYINRLENRSQQRKDGGSITSGKAGGLIR